MSFTDQHGYSARCEWGIRGLEALADAKVVIIVDVLSFSTSVDIATSRGAVVLPYPYKDGSARQYSVSRNAVLATSRSREHFSLAPSSLTGIPRETRLVLPSPNGSTLAFAARDSGAHVAVGCLRNCHAVSSWASSMAGSIAVIPAGELWPDGSLRPAIEDWLGAGAILKGLPGTRSPEAAAAVAAFENASHGIKSTLASCSSGRELIERGFDADIELAAAVGSSSVIPRLQDDEIIGES